MTLINPENVLNEISQTQKGKSSGSTRMRCPELSHSETQGRTVAATAMEDGIRSWCPVNTACFSEERAADPDAGDVFTGL